MFADHLLMYKFPSESNSLDKEVGPDRRLNRQADSYTPCKIKSSFHIPIFRSVRYFQKSIFHILVFQDAGMFIAIVTLNIRLLSLLISKYYIIKKKNIYIK